eukprot:Phypoly_transcript_09045.p1 GENE.Phypoly_transcript_09045~~Phypoly_transcript_09045.p1  ORF type:complete len:311 (+),score=53.93 Phypoly_transcript_09045:497-1429(+)
MAPYGFESTAEQVANGEKVDLNNKNVIVTGGYTGIGLETCRVFALHGAHVYVVGRDANKGHKAVDQLKQSTGKANIEFMECDLASFASVRSFAEKFKALNKPLHYLILNAGVMMCPYSKTVDGFENQFGTNALGHFLLANLLVPSLLAGAPSRVVSVSSAGHAISGILWDDYNFEKTPYSPAVAYGQSKTGNVLFAVEFNRLYKDKGITATSLHPGAIFETELARHTQPDDFSPEKMKLIPNIEELLKYNLTPKSIAQGAATTMYAALSPDAAQGGGFYFDCHEAPARPHAADPENAKRFWALATKLTGL